MELWKKVGFRNFIIKCIIFVFIGIMLQVVVSNYFSHTAFFKEYLEIPSAFYVEPTLFKVFLVNAFLFGLVAFILRSFEKIKNIKDFNFKKHQYIFLALAIIIFIGHYFFKFLINQNLEFFMQNATFWAVVKIIFHLLFFTALGLGIFGLHFLKYVLKEYKREIIFFISIAVGFFILMRLVHGLWQYFSSTIAYILYRIFGIFFADVTYIPFVPTGFVSGGGPMLGIGSFKAVIGGSCSGIDSFLLFTALYALLFILDHKKIKKPLAILLFFVGAIGMFLTNVLRILLLFIVGAYVDKDFAIGMFHTNAGWILFIIYFFIFWTLASRLIYKNEKKIKK
ncbi:TPA: archaeosortase/exosortase family protein [Candidatus Woesearchaeota archaeon]|nr:archaeosortase/exosortase family protein [Candidatus Woesearchaeota archaeon]HIH54903.1 archaeosortase/exosortase family protein [Candidatus Woesearchaeota archaeon]HIJ14628.1 archaeosortase/exosortase family protein [Candidatus Woesearchaeota archaeon]